MYAMMNNKNVICLFEIKICLRNLPPFEFVYARTWMCHSFKALTNEAFFLKKKLFD